MTRIIAMVSAADVETANTEMQNLGFGPEEFNFPLMRDGEVTHFGCHHWHEIPELSQLSVPVDIQKGDNLRFSQGLAPRGVSIPDDMTAIPWPPEPDWMDRLPMRGDVRTFDGEDYQSTMDGNPYFPPHGWEKVGVSEPQPEPDGPTGDEWAAGVAYETGDTVTYDGTTYTCEQGHTSQDGWEPPNVPALWAEGGAA